VALLKVLDEGAMRARSGLKRHYVVPLVNVLDEGAAQACAGHAVGCARMVLKCSS
jgi:hypothetical protein